MPLTQEQSAELRRAIESNAPSDIITTWLTETCGLSFQESFVIRRKILEQILDEKNLQQNRISEPAKEARTPQLEEAEDSGRQDRIQEESKDFLPEGYSKRKGKSGRKSKQERLDSIYGGLDSGEIQEYSACAECGTPKNELGDWQCSCPCQNPNLIPF